MWSMITGVVRRELLYVWRDRIGLVLLIVVPALAMTVGGFALRGVFEGRPSKIRLIVDDQDGGEVTRLIVDRLSRVPVLRTVDATDVSADGHHMVLRIPPGFSARYERSLAVEMEFEADAQRASESHVVRAVLRELQARLAAGQTASHLAATQIIAYTGDVDLRLLRAEAMRGATRDEPDAVQIVERPRSGSSTLRSFDLQVPGLAVMFLLFGALSGVGRRILDDQATGRLQRVLLAPGGFAAALGGVLIARGGIGIVQVAVLLIFGHVAFAVPLGSSIVALIAVVVFIVASAVCFGVLLGGLARSEEQLNALGIAAILTMSALGGCWWPLYLEPDWMQRLANLTVTRWAMHALTGVLLQGVGVGDIAHALAFLGAFAVSTLTVGTMAYRRKLLAE